MERKPGEFYLGSVLDEKGERTDAVLSYDATDLTTHGVIVGMTGSGKTGLGIVAIEEALLAGIPVLVLDPKGDMTNLKLTFPGLAASDFRPWVNEGDAKRAGQSLDDFAGAQAELWAGGLSRAGLGTADLEALRAAGTVTIYTPGSEAGVPLNVVGSLAPPGGDANAESVREEAAAVASGLLSLVGIEADPLASREHILLSNLIERAWVAGQALDLGTLIAQTMDPPVRKLGVFEVDTFFPPNDRRALALRLNALVASASFAAWTQGAPLDIGALLFTPDGRPRVSVVYLAHLSDAERQFVVSLVLAKFITWMRAQSGTTDLRALIYMDEMFGFAPPSAEPPSKRGILTLLKQARAYGVGLLLSTQNPVDLDYKAMSNAGTWVIGRLQTERDKERVLEGLRSASGSVDVDAIGRLISGLGARQFVLHNTHERGGPQLFTTRWAMSYLRGPLTREQIESLEPDHDPAPGAAPAPPAPPATGAPSRATAAPEVAPAPAPSATEPADASRVAPAIASGVPVFYADPSAGWLEAVGAGGGSRLAPALAARLYLRFDDTKLQLDQTDEWEAVLFPLEARVDLEALRHVDYDARDLRSTPPDGALYALTGAPLGTPSYFRDFERDLKDHLTRTSRRQLQVNRKLKLASRVDESAEDFAKRCDDAAQTQADAEVAKLRDRYDAKIDRVRDAIDRATDRVDVLKTDTSTRRTSEVLGAVGDILGSFLGGRSTTRTIATGAGRVLRGATSRRGQSARTSSRLDAAEGQLTERQADLEELEAELLEEITEVNDRWEAVGKEIETVDVGLEKSDVTVQEIALVWLPTRG
ncbi:MAG: DUF853 family protein [Dehalococcoidia bacterium]|nr:DUF853 family protein [Dehalococcoidia bacterium]